MSKDMKPKKQLILVHLSQELPKQRRDRPQRR